jgi:hypothetical protein
MATCTFELEIDQRAYSTNQLVHLILAWWQRYLYTSYVI